MTSFFIYNVCKNVQLTDDIIEKEFVPFLTVNKRLAVFFLYTCTLSVFAFEIGLIF